MTHDNPGTVKRPSWQERLAWGRPYDYERVWMDANMIYWALHYIAYWKHMRRGAA